MQKGKTVRGMELELSGRQELLTGKMDPMFLSLGI